MKKLNLHVTGVFVSLLLIVGLTGCLTINLSSGEKYRIIKPVKDRIKINPENLDKNRFDLETYLHYDSIGSTQYVLPSDINEIVNSLEQDLLVYFFYPNCSGAYKVVQRIKEIEKLEIPFIVLSDIHSPRKMEELYSIYKLQNKNKYIIPWMEGSSDITSIKMMNFIKELSPESYDQYGDELIFISLMKVSKSGPPQFYSVLKGGPGQPLNPLDWVKKMYELN